MSAPLRASLQSGPARLPVSLNEVKLHFRIEDDQSADDALILGYLNAAIRAAEHFTRRALITQTWRVFMDDWPRRLLGGDDIQEGFHIGADLRRLGVEITLPYPPLLSVTHVKTYDDNDVATTWAASNYFVDTTSIPGRIVARDGVSLPVATRVANGIEIEFVAGYGDDEADVPETVRTGILIMAAHLHEHRGDDDPAKAAQASGATSYWRAEKVFVA